MNRSISADLIKVISIFGVVFIHSSGLLGTSSEFQTYTGSLFRFCVPCFIIIWACFFEKAYKPKTQIERKKFILSKLKHLFTVFFIWSLLYFLILVDYSNLKFTTLISKHFSGNGWSGQYFFIILFQLIILFPLLRKLYCNKIIRYILVTLIIALYCYYGYFNDKIPELLTKIGYRLFLFWVPYVFVGFAVVEGKIKKLPIISTLIILIIPLESYFFGFERSVYITPSILLASILFCITILQNNINIISEKTSKIITYIGANTMTIFVSNPIVILILSPLIPKDIPKNSFLGELFLPFISTFLVLSLTLIISILINKSYLKSYLN